jgi:hypothetical protein
MAPKPFQRLRIDPMFIGCGSLNLFPEIFVRSIAFADRRQLHFKPNWDSQKNIEGSSSRPVKMEFLRLKLPIPL